MNTAVRRPIETMPVSPSRMYRLTVKQYHRMIEAGILTKYDRLELLEGLLVSKMPRTPAHDGTLSVLTRELRRLTGDNWAVRPQCAITTSNSEPEPDVVVATGTDERYLDRHPGPGDIALVVEVAASNLDEDRTRMARIYARARIPVYWIVNLTDRWVEVYAQPRAGRSPAYRQRQDFGLRDVLPLVLHDEPLAELPVRTLFPF